MAYYAQAGVDALSASIVDRASWHQRWPLKSVAESPPRLGHAASWASTESDGASPGAALHTAPRASPSARAASATFATSAVRAAPFASSPSRAVGFTAVVMTYGSLARALNARQKCNKFTSSSSALVHECILLFNRGAISSSSTGDAASWEPPEDFMASVPRGRLLVAATNDLLNRFNTTILQPATDAYVATKLLWFVALIAACCG